MNNGNTLIMIQYCFNNGPKHASCQLHLSRWQWRWVVSKCRSHLNDDFATIGAGPIHRICWLPRHDWHQWIEVVVVAVVFAVAIHMKQEHWQRRSVHVHVDRPNILVFHRWLSSRDWMSLYQKLYHIGTGTKAYGQMQWHCSWSKVILDPTKSATIQWDDDDWRCRWHRADERHSDQCLDQ